MTDRQEIVILAGEFVLGSLTDDEREAVRVRLTHDSLLASAVADWERELAPLTALERAITPPPAVLEGVLSSIASAALLPGGRSGEVALLRHQVRNWRFTSGALAASMGALAIALGALLYAPGRGLDSQSAMAVLTQPAGHSTADEGQSSAPALFIARASKEPASVVLRQVGGRRPSNDRIYTVWLLNSDLSEATRLGTMSKTEPTTKLQLPPGASHRLVGLQLAISLESEKSQALEQPRGPILSIGKFDVQ